jgi:hypothetical protein
MRDQPIYLHWLFIRPKDFNLQKIKINALKAAAKELMAESLETCGLFIFKVATISIENDF